MWVSGDEVFESPACIIVSTVGARAPAKPSIQSSPATLEGQQQWLEAAGGLQMVKSLCSKAMRV